MRRGLQAGLWAGLSACTSDPGPVDTGSGGLLLSELAVEAAPANPLAAWVSWTTNEPTDSHVVFQTPGTPRFRVGHDGLTTHHRVLVHGMRAGFPYTLEAESETLDGDRVRATPVTHTPGPLPSHVPRADVLVHDPELARQGWTLFDNYRYAVDAPNTAVIVDMAGYPVWVHTFEAGDDLGAMDVRLTAEGTVLLGPSLPSGYRPREVDLAGEILWEGPEQPGFSQDDFLHHHMEVLDDGGLLTLAKRFVDGTRGDRIVVLDRDGKETWSWDLFDHIDPVWVEEWTHCNSVTADGDDLYLSNRVDSEIIKLSRSTGEIAYRLSEAGGFSLDGGWLEEQHAPEVLGPDHLLIYDNGTSRRTTRVVEVVVDPETRTAQRVWQYPTDPDDPDEGWFTGYWGDADRLDNGNTLIAAGASQVNRMTEVTPEGSTAWQAQWPTEGDLVVGFYRAERIDLPGVEVLDD